MAFKKIRNFAIDVGRGFQDFKKNQQRLDKKSEKLAGNSGSRVADRREQGKIIHKLRQNNPSLIDSIAERRRKRRVVGR